MPLFAKLGIIQGTPTPKKKRKERAPLSGSQKLRMIVVRPSPNGPKGTTGLWKASFLRRLGPEASVSRLRDGRRLLPLEIDPAAACFALGTTVSPKNWGVYVPCTTTIPVEVYEP